MAQRIDVAHCEALVERALGGDARSQRALVEYLWPSWIAQARASRNMGKLAQSEDHVREVATRVAEKIGKKGGHGLRLYSLWRERHSGKDFGDWIRIVQSNVIREYLREQIGYKKVTDGEISQKRLLNEFTGSALSETLGFRPPYTAKQTARQVVEFAQAHLPPDQLRAVELWLEGASNDELDREMGTKPGGGRELMRAGVAMLRRKFAGAEAGQ